MFFFTLFTVACVGLARLLSIHPLGVLLSISFLLSILQHLSILFFCTQKHISYTRRCNKLISIVLQCDVVFRRLVVSCCQSDAVFTVKLLESLDLETYNELLMRTNPRAQAIMSKVYRGNYVNLGN